MAEETNGLSINGDSKIAGISVRGWVVILLVVTVCGMSWAGIEVKEPLYTLVVAACSYYYGQRNPNKASQALQ